MFTLETEEAKFPPSFVCSAISNTLADVNFHTKLKLTSVVPPCTRTPTTPNQIFTVHVFVQSEMIPQLSSVAVFTLHTKVTEQSSPTWSVRNSLKWGPVVVRGRRKDRGSQKTSCSPGSNERCTPLSLISFDCFPHASVYLSNQELYFYVKSHYTRIHLVFLGYQHPPLSLCSLSD